MRFPAAPSAALLLAAPLAALLHAAPPLAAQTVSGQTPQISTRELAMRYIVGRYVSPVTCTREDGTLVQTHQAMTVRQDPTRSATSTRAFVVRATLFGIDVSDVEYCHNLMDRRLDDRRGVFFVSYRGQAREDLGASDFRREMRDGEISYRVQEGRITSRTIGEREGETSTLDLTGADAVLHIRRLARRSDGERMLSRWAAEEGYSRRSQPMELELTIPEGESFKVWAIKDVRADDKGHRSGSRR